MQGVFLPSTTSIKVQGVSASLAVWTCRVSVYFQQYGCACAGCISTTSSMNAVGVFPSTTRSRGKRAGCAPFNLHTVFVNARMPDYPASGTRMKKNGLLFSRHTWWFIFKKHWKLNTYVHCTNTNWASLDQIFAKKTFLNIVIVTIFPRKVLNLRAPTFRIGFCRRCPLPTSGQRCHVTETESQNPFRAVGSSPLVKSFSSPFIGGNENCAMHAPTAQQSPLFRWCGNCWYVRV